MGLSKWWVAGHFLCIKIFTMKQSSATLFVCIIFEETHGDQDLLEKISAENPITLRRALLRNWRQTASNSRAGTPHDQLDWPPFGLSDNANGALVVTHELGCFELRCVSHVLQIVIRRLCFVEKTPRGSRHPHTVPERQKFREVVVALEALRAWAQAFRSKDLLAEWVRQHRGGDRNKCLHLDSSSSWSSTLELVEDALRLKDDLAAFAATYEGAHALPSAVGWQRLAFLPKPLAELCSATNVLQATDARLAQVVPAVGTALKRMEDLVAASTTDEEREVCAGFLEETRGRVDAHLRTPWRVPVPRRDPIHTVLAKSEISSYWELAEVAALMACGPLESSFPWLGLHTDKVRRSLELLCREVDKLQNLSLWQRDVNVAIRLELPDVAQPKKKKAKLTQKSARSTTADLRVAMPGAHVPLESSDAALSNRTAVLTVAVRSLLGCGVLPGSRCGTAICAWWQKPIAITHRDLIWTARFLNGIPASNGYLERAFGSCSELWSDPSRKTSLGRQLVLQHSAFALGLPSYIDPAGAADEAAESDCADDVSQEEGDGNAGVR